MFDKRRLDEELVVQGFFEDTDSAKRAIMAGDVSGEGERYTSAGMQIKKGSYLHVKNRYKKYVSRGGYKLAGALKDFSFSPSHLICLDVGCSTGGFTDCLLQQGAKKVFAVDVGYGQFDWELRNDERVVLFERTNIHDVTLEDVEGPVDLAVADVSFTSVEHFLPKVVSLLNPEKGVFISLIKPQFEVQRENISKGGIVRDTRVHKHVMKTSIEAFEKQGLSVKGISKSNIRGQKGNIEFFIYASQKPGKLVFGQDLFDELFV